MRIGLVVYPGCIPSGLMAFAEILTACNQRTQQRTFECVFTSVDGTPVTLTLASQGPSITIEPQTSLAEGQFDALLLPGFWASSEQDCAKALAVNRELIDTLSRLASTTQLWGYCSAVCLLAASRQLEGRRATATWWLAQYLSTAFTGVNWQFNDTQVEDQQLITASGVQGYLAIANTLIQNHCGAAILAEINKLMVIARPQKAALPWQRIEMIKSKSPEVARAYRWVEQTPAQDLTLNNFAAALNMSTRTLARRIANGTDASAAQFMRLVKIQQACDLITYQGLSVKEVVDRLGYGDETSFRRTFKQVTTLTPAQYRQLIA
ncbi:GlxA family transcriptional regulator [Pseudoalteromonas sp. T1lg76]|uniref:GlxA family transcriptional regulator n=1 Tax=Pseudoalteromonas sp. T1lg76 TaxID=2077103 RepID=UPI000CF74BEB|nr:helix-turn-helix domain-containing protein [Pseudoalteromonas sp. T1lg76]